MAFRWAAWAGVAWLGILPAVAAESEQFSDSSPSRSRYSAVGLASWYGAEFQGRATADGERFDPRGLSAAHKSLPLPCYARVTNLNNGRSIVVRVNDRGPYVAGRMLDVSARVANLLDFGHNGVVKVRLDYVGKAAPAGSDGSALLASLRKNGAPVAAPGPPTAFAFAPSAAPSPAVAAITRAESRSVDETTAVARADDPPKLQKPRWPWGELVTYPFLVNVHQPSRQVASR